MPQALAVLLRKRDELQRSLMSCESDCTAIEREIQALNQAIEYIQQKPRGNQARQDRRTN